MKQGNCARGIAAGTHFTAVGIEYTHPEIGGFALFQQDKLVAADPGMPVCDCENALPFERWQGVFTRIQHDEVVSKSVHLDKRNAHQDRASRVCGA